jgi:thiaminase/transcriptional activator TenA
MSKTDELWAEMAPTYAAILTHPFITGLRDGSLPEDRFRYYVLQDSLYLRDYCRALSALAGRAPEPEWTALFATHAAEAIRVEQELHAGLLERLGNPEPEPASPTTTAYTSYLLATVHGGSFAEGLGAVLPCYWIYRDVGRELARAGSPHPLYADWIATYGDPQFDAVVEAVLDVVDRVDDGDAMRPHVGVCARYEYMFWDAAWRLERWPLGAEVMAHD